MVQGDGFFMLSRCKKPRVAGRSLMEFHQIWSQKLCQLRNFGLEELLGPVSHLPSLKLTARPWKITCFF